MRDLLSAVRSALGQPDSADIAVEYLRQWKCWKLTDEVLALGDKKRIEDAILRLRVLHYALQCPDPRAAQFVTARRRVDPAGVEEAEEVLRAKEKPDLKRSR